MVKHCRQRGRAREIRQVDGESIAEDCGDTACMHQMCCILLLSDCEERAACQGTPLQMPASRTAPTSQQVQVIHVGH